MKFLNVSYVTFYKSKQVTEAVSWPAVGILSIFHSLSQDSLSEFVFRQSKTISIKIPVF
jgi:hypothetical protein